MDRLDSCSNLRMPRQRQPLETGVKLGIGYAIVLDRSVLRECTGYSGTLSARARQFAGWGGWVTPCLRDMWALALALSVHARSTRAASAQPAVGPGDMLRVEHDAAVDPASCSTVLLTTFLTTRPDWQRGMSAREGSRPSAELLAARSPSFASVVPPEVANNAKHSHAPYPSA